MKKNNSAPCPPPKVPSLALQPSQQDIYHSSSSSESVSPDSQFEPESPQEPLQVDSSQHVLKCQEQAIVAQVGMGSALAPSEPGLVPEPFHFKKKQGQKAKLKQTGKVIVKQEEKSKEKSMEKSRERTRKKDKHNLKSIARHILGLVTHNVLSIKQIGCLLFQIMEETDFGMQLVREGYPRVDQRSIEPLCKKYASKKEEAEKEKSEAELAKIRNARRRLYDAVNVMIAANVLIRGPMDKEIRLSEQYRLKQLREEKYDHLKLEHRELSRITRKDPVRAVERELQKQEKKVVKEEGQEPVRTHQYLAMEKKLEAKKKEIQQLEEKRILLRELQKRNQFRRTINSQQIPMPVLAVTSFSEILFKVGPTSAEITCQDQLLVGDEECMRTIFNNHRRREHKPFQ